MARDREAILFAILAVLLLSLTTAGCFRYGRPFPTGAVSAIVTGQTTRLQISDTFGPPVRTGLDDGNITWTYLDYRYSLFGGTGTRDLVIRFDKHGLVTSYTFNSSYPGDQKR